MKASLTNLNDLLPIEERQCDGGIIEESSHEVDREGGDGTNIPKAGKGVPVTMRQVRPIIECE